MGFEQSRFICRWHSPSRGKRTTAGIQGSRFRRLTDILKPPVNTRENEKIFEKYAEIIFKLVEENETAKLT